MYMYSKGARSERELIGIFAGKAFSVMRAAGSGVNSISPDIVAFKDGKGFLFECKAWSKGSLSINQEHMSVLRKWEKDTNMHAYIAWRIKGKGWFFIKLDELSKSEKNFTITMKTTFQIGRDINALLEGFDSGIH
ncbi:MAG: Holliday junction resolvase Hjc [Candidatus Micrarchaeia archaeon]